MQNFHFDQEEEEREEERAARGEREQGSKEILEARQMCSGEKLTSVGCPSALEIAVLDG